MEPAKSRLKSVSRLLTALKATVQVPAGRVLDPVHVPSSVVPGPSARNVVRVVDPFEATAVTLLAVSPSLSLPT
jgi:hypothetical protein